MATVTFSTLKDRLGRRIIDENTSFTTEQGDLINFAHRELQDRYNFKVMEAKTTAVTSALTRALVSIPSDWKEARAEPWLVDVSGNTDHIVWIPTEHEAQKSYDDNTTVDTGEPQFLLENATTIDVYPYSDSNSDHADSEYRIVIPYWKYLTELSADGDNDYLTNTYPWAIVYFATAQGFWLNQDEQRATFWEQKAEAQIRNKIRTEKKKKFRRTGFLRPRINVYGPFHKRSF